jgi:hypothetical protein
VKTIFRFIFFLICQLTKLLFYLDTFCIPELILYPIIFRYISEKTNATAQAGILMPEVIQRRRQQTSINICVTCLACVAQLVTNIIFAIFLIVFFGESKFYHSLVALIYDCLNFNLIPIFYIIMIDDEIKRSIFRSHSD